jgi:cobalamin-dependent methionine synthase I
MLIVGERINSSRREIADAMKAKDKKFIQREAEKQAEAGSDYIDVNAGSFIDEEEERLRWLIETVQEAIDVPLCIDSPDADVICESLKWAKRTPMINSVSLDQVSLDKILPLVKKHECKVIALCQSETMMAKTSENKVELAGRLIAKLVDADVPLEAIFIDPLVYPVSTDTSSAKATLEAIRFIKDQYPLVHMICGLTNVSYGLPSRKLINRTFLAIAVAHGLDAAILDPTDKSLFSVLKSSLTLCDRDEYCGGYIQAFRKGQIE